MCQSDLKTPKQLRGIGIARSNVLSALGNVPQAHFGWQPGGQCQRGTSLDLHFPGRWGKAEGTKPCCVSEALCTLAKKPWAKLHVQAASSAPGTKGRQCLIPVLGNSSFGVGWVLLSFHPLGTCLQAAARTSPKLGRFLRRGLPCQTSSQ